MKELKTFKNQTLDTVIKDWKSWSRRDHQISTDNISPNAKSIILSDKARGEKKKKTSFSLPVVMLHIYVYTRKHHKKKQNGLQEEINETTLKPCSRAEDNMVLVFLNTKIDLQKEKIVCKTNWNLNWVLAWLDYPASNALMERLRRGVKVFSVRGLGFGVSNGARNGDVKRQQFCVSVLSVFQCLKCWDF